MTPDEIRSFDLPTRFLGGFDEDATYDLLEAVANSLAAVLAERDALLRELEELRSSTRERSSYANAEAIGSALVTANRLSEKLLAEAREEAAKITDTAQSAAQEHLRRARLDAQGEVAQAEGQIAALNAKYDRLRATIIEQRQQLVAFIRGSVEQLADPDGAGESDPSRQLARDLRERLRDPGNASSTEGRPSTGDRIDIRTTPAP